MKYLNQCLICIIIGCICFLCYNYYIKNNYDILLNYFQFNNLINNNVYYNNKYNSFDEPKTNNRLLESRLLDEKDCRSLLKTYDVVIDYSWGLLPLEYQKRWSISKCDKYFTTNTNKKHNDKKPNINNNIETDNNNNNNNEFRAAGYNEVLTEEEDKHIVGNNAAAWCRKALNQYHVQPQRTWGQLPSKMILAWKKHHCDAVFAADRINRISITNCSKDNNIVKYDTLPLIAIMAGSSTRKTPNANTKNLAIFNFLLPSLTRTVDCGFRYLFMIGYDEGDVFYDSEIGKKEVELWFNNNVQIPLANNGINIILGFTSLRNILRKPGPIFIAMAREVYNKYNADYYYRVNDDTEMIDHWPIAFVNTLRKLSPPYGVVGPFCQQGNTMILTHDFVHKTHMEIFEMNYYPPELVDWWMDDWISFVYGKSRSFKAESVRVVHHTGAHGQRYEVDRKNFDLLPSLLKNGRQLIRKWIMKHYEGNDNKDKILTEFDRDDFSTFIHNNIPM